MNLGFSAKPRKNKNIKKEKGVASLILRDYQEKVVGRIIRGILDGQRRFLVVFAPGGGKGSIITHLLHKIKAKQNSGLMFVHKRELVLDILDRLRNHFGYEAGLILSGFGEDRQKLIQLASVQTAIRRELGKYKVIITDEAHRVLSPSQQKILDKNKDSILISFTATPFRLDRKSFEMYDELIHPITYRELMARRYLLPTDVIVPQGTAKIDGVKIRGDYVVSDLEKRYMKERLYSGLYEQWKHWMGCQSTMIFNVGKRHNKEVYEYFKGKGESVAYVDDQTPRKEREYSISAFKRGEIQVLCNIGIFGEGIDAEICSGIILNYATKSLAKYIQTVARGSRPMWDGDDWKKENGEYVKTKITVLDMGGNTVRFGKLEDYDALGLDLSGKRSKMPAPTKYCTNCRRVVYASATECKFCGYMFPRKEKKDEKKYADEVEFGRFKEERSIEQKILKKKHSALQKAPVEWLRIIAIIKGYKPGWVRRVLISRKEIKAYNYPANGKGFMKMHSFLTSREKEKGMFEVYQAFKIMYSV